MYDFDLLKTSLRDVNTTLQTQHETSENIEKWKNGTFWKHEKMEH